MIHRFLGAKHWQLFVLTFGISVLTQIVAVFAMIMNVSLYADKAGPEFALKLATTLSAVVFPAILLVSFIHYGWIWSVAIGLQAKIEEKDRLNVKLFKIFFFFPVVYLGLVFLFMIFLVVSIPAMIDSTLEPPATLIAWIILIIPFHFFAIFCGIYQIYFVAKTIKTAELQRSVTFSDYVGEFFMVWFYIIGIWFLQPRINKLAE